MPRFYTHVHNSTGFVRDEEGRDFASLDEAHQAAFDSVRSIVGEEARQGLIDLNGSIEIADEGGDVLLRFAFAEAFEIRWSDLND